LIQGNNRRSKEAIRERGETSWEETGFESWRSKDAGKKAFEAVTPEAPKEEN
jgi:hypothetical protein